MSNLSEKEIIKILKRIYKNLKFEDSEGRIAIERNISFI